MIKDHNSESTNPTLHPTSPIARDVCSYAFWKFAVNLQNGILGIYVLLMEHFIVLL